MYIAAQIVGGIVGVLAAHFMFELPLWQVSVTVRTGPGQWFAESVATFGLLLTIFGCGARTPEALPYSVGLYITAAYWFTASTSFANPAVTIARALSDTYAGIAPTACLHLSPLKSLARLSPWLLRVGYIRKPYRPGALDPARAAGACVASRPIGRLRYRARLPAGVATSRQRRGHRRGGGLDRTA
jgi:hypothetical protein